MQDENEILRARIADLEARLAEVQKPPAESVSEAQPEPAPEPQPFPADVPGIEGQLARIEYRLTALENAIQAIPQNPNDRLDVLEQGLRQQYGIMLPRSY